MTDPEGGPPRADDAGDDELFVERPSGFEQIPDGLHMDIEVSDGAVRMYLLLSKCGARDDGSMPSRRRLAELCARPAKDGQPAKARSLRTVDARIAELVERGWLLVTPRWRGGGKGQASNKYRLLWTPIGGPDDPRLVAHQRAVTRFEEQMVARRAVNEAAREAADGEPEGAPTAAGEPDTAGQVGRDPVQDFAPPPVQDFAGGPPSNILQGGGAIGCTPPRATICTPVPIQTPDPDLPYPHPSSELRSELGGTGACAREAVPEQPALMPLPDDPADQGQPADDPAATTQAIATAWWEHYKTHRGPIVQNGRARLFLALRRMVRSALEAGYTDREIRDVLADLGKPVPQMQVFQDRLAERRSGARPRTGGRDPGPAPSWARSGLRPADPAPAWVTGGAG